ncbi:hypothetical protein L7F22_042196 [Adiantum nelumboides]|nr:hypothetical protein [Adiantum nelumboides]
MHMQGCEAKFAESEVKRFLDDKTFKLWSRMQTSEEIKSAKIAGLEACPFCWYSYVVYPEDKDKPFFCGNAECGKWSCHHCKRLAHEGKTCEEARQANMTSAHRAEEKLAEALMRRCPKAGCNTVVVKDEVQRSCNKISCTKCNTTMCYVCRKDISKEGYAHFDQHARPQPEVKEEGRSSPKCPLFDDTTERHKKDVNIARKEVGKLAPLITPAEIEDDQRRQQRFDRMYGRNAARVPGVWGFPDDAHNQRQPLNHFGGDENRIVFGLVQQQFRRLGEGRAQALDRNLQEEADRREAERGDPEVVRLERERQLVERQVEMRHLAPAYHVHYANGNVDAIGVGPMQGHLFAPMLPRNAVQERNDRVQREPNNAARLNLDQLARQMQDMRNNINEMEGALGYLNARNRIAELNARILDQRHNLVNDPQNLNQANVQVGQPERNNNRNGLRLRQMAPSLTPRGDKADKSIKKEKKESKPDLKLRKVNHEWQWLERSVTPRDKAGTQTRDNKGEGSSKEKAIILEQEAAQAGPSKSAKKLSDNVIIDLTMSSDEEIDPFHDDDDDDLIYL